MLGKLIVIGATVLNLGTIYEADGIVERSFRLCNDGRRPVAIVQGYTSCGCTTVTFPKDSVINAGDTASVTLRFNPRGKGGEFYESAHLKYKDLSSALPSREGEDVSPSLLGEEKAEALGLALEGTCVTSEETLLLQHPVVINDNVRISRDRYDLGYVSVGEKRERTVSVWHRDTNQRESFTISFQPTADTKKGLNHVPNVVKIHTSEGEVATVVTFDVIVR